MAEKGNERSCCKDCSNVGVGQESTWDGQTEWWTRVWYAFSVREAKVFFFEKNGRCVVSTRNPEDTEHRNLSGFLNLENTNNGAYRRLRVSHLEKRDTVWAHRQLAPLSPAWPSSVLTQPRVWLENLCFFPCLCAQIFAAWKPQRLQSHGHCSVNLVSKHEGISGNSDFFFKLTKQVKKKIK